MDRSTLKNRLKRLARVITKQYREAKRGKRLSVSRCSTASHSTVDSALTASSSLRDSFASHSTRDSVSSYTSADSLRTLQNAVNNKANLSSESGSKKQNDVAKSNSADSRASMASSSSSILSSIPEGASTSRAPGPQTTGDSSEPALKEKSAGDTIVTHENSTASGSGNAGVSSGRESMSELERQKAVNEKLQQQILENIRQQEELVRQLQTRQQVPAPTSAGLHAQVKTPVSAGSQGEQETAVQVLPSGQTQAPATASIPAPTLTPKRYAAPGLSSSISSKMTRSANIGSPQSMPAGSTMAASMQGTQAPNMNALNFSAMSGVQQNLLAAHAARTALFNSAMQSGGRIAAPMAPTPGMPNLYSNFGSAGILTNPFAARTPGAYAASGLTMLGRSNVPVLGTNQAVFAAMQPGQMLQGVAGNVVAGSYSPGMSAQNPAQRRSSDTTNAPDVSNSETSLSPSKFKR